jgi:hypothetical protein
MDKKLLYECAPDIAEEFLLKFGIELENPVENSHSIYVVEHLTRVLMFMMQKMQEIMVSDKILTDKVIISLEENNKIFKRMHIIRTVIDSIYDSVMYNKFSPLFIRLLYAYRTGELNKLAVNNNFTATIEQANCLFHSIKAQGRNVLPPISILLITAQNIDYPRGTYVDKSYEDTVRDLFKKNMGGYFIDVFTLKNIN